MPSKFEFRTAILDSPSDKIADPLLKAPSSVAVKAEGTFRDSCLKVHPSIVAIAVDRCTKDGLKLEVKVEPVMESAPFDSSMCTESPAVARLSINVVDDIVTSVLKTRYKAPPFLVAVFPVNLDEVIESVPRVANIAPPSYATPPLKIVFSEIVIVESTAYMNPPIIESVWAAEYKVLSSSKMQFLKVALEPTK